VNLSTKEINKEEQDVPRDTNQKWTILP